MAGSVFVIIPAGGTGSRTGFQQPKQFQTMNGVPVLRKTVQIFKDCAKKVVVPVPADHLEKAQHILQDTGANLCQGGATRFQSVKNGFLALGNLDDDDLVLIHDAARPFFDASLLNDLPSKMTGLDGIIFAKRATDTIKKASTNIIEETIPRDEIWLAQTPQIFFAASLKRAYSHSIKNDLVFTDEASLMEACQMRIGLVEANPNNDKLTYREDFMQQSWAIGHGYDVHRYDPNRPLFLCGHEIPEGPGLLGHSDADVALHAVMDAILGALGEGDIGQWFPDNDPKFKGADSKLLFAEIWKHARKQGFELGNVDVTIVAQTPKLSPHRQAMKNSLARCFQTEETTKINVKATTTEGLGFVGEKQGMEAHAVVILQRGAQ